MFSRKTRAQSKTLQSKAVITVTEPVESPTTENRSENQQAPSFIVACPPLGETPSKGPLTLESPSKDQSIPGNFRVIPHVGEGPSKSPSTRESPTTLPHLKGPSEEQLPTKDPSEDPKPAENLTVTLPTGEALSKAPPAKEHLTILLHLESPSKGQPTTEAQAADRQTMEDPTTNQQGEKALEDTPALASLPNGRSAADVPTTNLPDGEIPKGLRESSSHVQSTAEIPSEDHPFKGFPTCPSSGKQSDVSTADSDQEPPKGFPSHMLSSDVTQDTSQPTNHEANSHKYRREESGKKIRFQARKGNVTIIDLTGIDSEDESEPSTSNSHQGQSPSPECKIVSGDFDSTQDSEYIRKKKVVLHATHPTSALLDSVEATYALLNSLQASTSKAFKDESTSRCKPHQPRPHMPVNEDTNTSSNDSDDDIIDITSNKRLSNSSKRSFKHVDDEADDHVISHKRPKGNKDTTLPDSQVNSTQDMGPSGSKPKTQLKRKTRSKFGRRSLRDSINTESGWLDTALQSSENLCQLSLERTVQFSKLIKLETEIAKLLNDISIEDRPQQLRKLIEQLRSVEERRRSFTDVLYRNGISEYGEYNNMKETVEQWILEETKVSKRIERSS